MYENCPKCGSPKLHPNARYFDCGHDSRGQFTRPTKCVAVEIAALTQRAEQAEEKYKTKSNVLLLTQVKLTAAEAEVKRLRDGIEAFVNEYSETSSEMFTQLLAHLPLSCQISERATKVAADFNGLSALLAHPSDGKEAGDDGSDN